MKQREISEKECLYYELYAFYKQRLKNKHMTQESFIFEQQAARKLARAAVAISEKSWEVEGYFPFNTYHPHRQINAPYYSDRVVEQWYVENYIQPAFVPDLYEYNMACRAGKGPFLTMDYVKATLEELYYMYGKNFWVFQYDVKGYFDNISHDAAKRIIGSKIDADAMWLYEAVVKSYETPDGYAALADPDKSHKYGFPKGNLPSQWTGIILLNELDRQISEDTECIFNIRYMDDGLNFFKTKEDCIRCMEKVREYFEENGLGIRLHPKKTYYAPISRGFTFCGWHYTLDDTGKVHVKIKNTKKKEMEHRLKAISHSVQKGTMSLEKANQIRKGMFNYLSHGTESRDLIRYMIRQYPFPTVEEERRKAAKRREKGKDKRKEF